MHLVVLELSLFLWNHMPTRALQRALGAKMRCLDFFFYIVNDSSYGCGEILPSLSVSLGEVVVKR